MNKERRTLSVFLRLLPTLLFVIAAIVVTVTHHPDLALRILVESSIFGSLCVLGVFAIMAPLHFDRRQFLENPLVLIKQDKRSAAIQITISSIVGNMLAAFLIMGIFSLIGVKINPLIAGLHVPIMLVAMLAWMPLYYTRHPLTRPGGIAFLLYYAAYAVYLCLAAYA